MTVAWRTSSPSTMASCALSPSRSLALPPLAHSPRSEPTWVGLGTRYEYQAVELLAPGVPGQAACRLCDGELGVLNQWTG